MWNYVQVEVSRRVLHPIVGPGGLTRVEAHTRVRLFLTRFAEVSPAGSTLLEAWDAGAEDDTVYAGPYLWAIYEAEDHLAGAHAVVDELAATLRGSGSKIRVAW